jgi:hypothetical protein
MNSQNHTLTSEQLSRLFSMQSRFSELQEELEELETLDSWDLMRLHTLRGELSNLEEEFGLGE